MEPVVHCDEKDRVSYTFFRLFARIEYALKRTGAELYLSGNEKEASPNWDRFATAVAGSFDPARTVELRDAVSYLLDHAPKKQVVCDGVLDWAPLERQGMSDLAWLLFLVRRIRNNLFHGGKFPSGQVADPARDIRLLRAGIIVLRECAALEKQISVHMAGFL